MDGLCNMRAIPDIDVALSWWVKFRLMMLERYFSELNAINRALNVE